VADHYATQVRLPETDPETIAPLAPPLRRSILPGTLCITLFWMAALGPGFVPPQRALMVGLSFGLAGLASLAAWIRARKADRVRMAGYLAERLCLDCGKRS
jgi:hypothetical protein